MFLRNPTSLVAALLVCLTLAGSLPAQQQTRRQTQRGVQIPPGVKAVRDVEYARPGGQPQLLDLYLPETGEGPRPLIVWVHGGAWRAGDKRRTPALRMTGQGYAVASINYRLSQQAIFPAQIEDCKAAIRWLRSQADKYSIDPQRIGVWGSSAGGHLVALLGVSGDVPELEGADGRLRGSSRVQAVCDFFGPTDFLQMDAHSPPNARIVHDDPQSPESQLIGGPIQEHKKETARANPITYVSKDDPPFLLMHGDRDPLVPAHQSEILFKALKAKGVDAELHIVKGGGHGFRGPEIDRKVDRFFARHLKPAASSDPADKGARKSKAEDKKKEDRKENRKSDGRSTRSAVN